MSGFLGSIGAGEVVVLFIAVLVIWSVARLVRTQF